MAWEIEYEHVDLAEGQHVVGFIEPTVMTRKGKPQQHQLVIVLHNELMAEPDGKLRAKDGTIIDPQDLKAQTLEQLNSRHEAMRRYASVHRVGLLKAK